MKLKREKESDSGPAPKARDATMVEQNPPESKGRSVDGSNKHRP